MSNEIPRRNRIELFTPAEKVIYEAMQEVEKLSADVRLTEAVVLLEKAQNKVADFVDANLVGDMQTPLTQSQFSNAARMISCIEDHAIKIKCVDELNAFSGSSTEDIVNRKIYMELSDVMKAVINISIGTDA